MHWSEKVFQTYAKHVDLKAGKPEWRMEDTAQAIGISVSTVSLDLRLAKALLENPDWRSLERQDVLHRIHRVEFYCSICAFPNEQHTTEQHCYLAWKGECERLKKLFGRVRRDIKSILSEIEGV